MKTTRASLTLIALLSSAALGAAACADPGTSDPAEEVGLAAQGGAGDGLSHAHMMRMPEEARAAHARRRSDGAGGYNFSYHGGPVLAHVKVVAVLWGQGVDNASSLGTFYQTVTASPYVTGLAEYNTSSQSIGAGSFAGTVVDSGAPAGGSLTDQQIQQEIGRLIGAGKVPAPDADTLYMVHFPAGVSITMDGNQSCQQFCAYHGTFQRGGADVFYGVMPDLSGPCAACGGTSDKLENTTIVSSHELAEAITDSAIGIANAQNDSSQLAWYDDQNGEIGDVCQSEVTLSSGWAVQKFYSMAAGGCVSHKSSSAPGGGSGGAQAAGCTHGVCLTGAPLLSTCGPCTAKVCQADASCCTSGWTSACVSEAVAICGKHCGG